MNFAGFFGIRVVKIQPPPPTAESVREHLGPRGPEVIAHAGRIKERVRDLLLEVFVAGKNRAQEMWREHGKGTFLGGVLFQEKYPRRFPNGRALFHHLFPFAFLSVGKIPRYINRLGEFEKSRGAELKQYPIWKTKGKVKEARWAEGENSSD